MAYPNPYISLKGYSFSSGALPGADGVVGQQDTNLVAGDDLELAVAGVDHDAHAVSVGVRAQDEVGALLLGDAQKHMDNTKR